MSTRQARLAKGQGFFALNKANAVKYPQFAGEVVRARNKESAANKFNRVIHKRGFAAHYVKDMSFKPGNLRERSRTDGIVDYTKTLVTLSNSIGPA